ncbi:MAG TPA: hypothetical protein VMC80_03870 [Patescibacteria group bacterium]|nr:hypothetical protein [Patescibacteria group bacterium]
MEIEAKIIFIIALFLAFIFIRLRAEYERKGHKTLTIFLKKITGLEIHHLHFGLFYAISALLWIFIAGFNIANLIILAIGISFIIDELFPAIIYLRTGEIIYYSKKSLIISIILHVITGAIFYFLF